MLMIAALFLGVFASTAAAAPLAGADPTVIGTITVDAANPFPATSPYASATVAKISLYTRADGKTDAAGSVKYYDLKAADGYVTLAGTFTAGTVDFLDFAPTGVTIENAAAPAPVVAPAWCTIMKMIALKIGISEADFNTAAPDCASTVVPAPVVPAPVVPAPVVPAPVVPAL